MTRRLLGVLSARLPELLMEKVKDPRKRRGRRWPLPSLLTSALLAMVSGAKSLAELEALTCELAVSTRRRFKVLRRVADTTLRGTLQSGSLGINPHIWQEAFPTRHR
ncbi:MAG: transposase family protein [Myxococcaceae bacterium]